MKFVFCDTEFSGLDYPNPKLISIGLVYEEIDGTRQEFYAVLEPNYYRDYCSDWVVQHVLPLLNAPPERRVKPDELENRLRAWLAKINDRVAIVSDSPLHDFWFFSEILRISQQPWPDHVLRTGVRFDSYCMGDAHHATLEWQRSQYFASGHREHNALDDANALRHMWEMAQPFPEFQTYLRKVCA